MKLFNIEINLNHNSFTPGIKSDGDDEILHHKFNCYSIKEIEYIFFCYMQQFETYTFADIKKFSKTFFYNFYFGNNFIRHLIGYMCDRNPISEVIVLKDYDWMAYFQNSEINDIRQFIKQNPTKK